MLLYNTYFSSTNQAQQYGIWPLQLINTQITVDYVFKLTCKKCITSDQLKVLKIEAYLVVIGYKKMLPLNIQ